MGPPGRGGSPWRGGQGWAQGRAPPFLLPVPQVSVEQLPPHRHPEFNSDECSSNFIF